jgi:hypothetical protein
MSRRRMTLLGAVCVLTGVFVGMAAAQAIDTAPRRYVNTAMFSVGTNQVAKFYVSLDDHEGAPPAQVLMQLFNANGAEMAKRETTLLPGQSAFLQSPGPGVYRAHAELREPDLQLSARRAAAGSVEIRDTLTGIVRPSCHLNPWPIPGGR